MEHTALGCDGMEMRGRCSGDRRCGSGIGYCWGVHRLLTLTLVMGWSVSEDWGRICGPLVGRLLELGRDGTGPVSGPGVLRFSDGFLQSSG